MTITTKNASTISLMIQALVVIQLRTLGRNASPPSPGTSSDLTDSSAAQAARGFVAASSAPPRSAPRAPPVADGEARLEQHQPDEQGDQREDRAAEDPQQRRHHEHEQPKWRDQRQPDQYPGRDAVRVGVALGGLAFHRPCRSDDVAWTTTTAIRGRAGSQPHPSPVATAHVPGVAIRDYRIRL